MTTELEKYTTLRVELAAVFTNFPKAKVTKKLFEGWDVHDILAHLNAWDAHEADILLSLQEGKEPYWIENIDKFNDLTVAARKGWDWQSSINEFNANTKKLLAIYEVLPHTLWTTRFWPDKPSTPESSLQESLSHYQEHLTALIKAK